jgi:hypothetical protein
LNLSRPCVRIALAILHYQLSLPLRGYGHELPICLTRRAGYSNLGQSEPPYSL